MPRSLGHRASRAGCFSDRPSGYLDVRFCLVYALTMLTDDQAEEIRRGLESGMRGPVLMKWVRQLLEDREEWVRRQREGHVPGCRHEGLAAPLG
jgi:hypothetical protein